MGGAYDQYAPANDISKDNLDTEHQVFTFAAAAYNLVRMRKLLANSVGAV